MLCGGGGGVWEGYIEIDNTRKLTIKYRLANYQIPIDLFHCQTDA